MSELFMSLEHVHFLLNLINEKHVKKLSETTTTTKCDLLEIGYDLFYEFLKMGSAALLLQEDTTSFTEHCIIEDEKIVKHVQSLIVDTQSVLQEFVYAFIDSEIVREDCDGEWNFDKCGIVRSGFKFMFDLFRGTGGEELKIVLDMLESIFVDYFDDMLKLVQSKITNLVINDAIPNKYSIPKSHYWWFLDEDEEEDPIIIINQLFLLREIGVSISVVDTVEKAKKLKNERA